MGDHLKCPDCNGTTFTASGNDCATCNGTGLLDEPLPAAPAPTPDPRDAEIAALRERIAALEAAIKDVLADGTTRAVLLREVTPLVERHRKVLHKALNGDTSALTAALAAERTRTVDDMKARVEGLPRSPVDHAPTMVVLAQALAAIEAAREGT